MERHAPNKRYILGRNNKFYTKDSRSTLEVKAKRGDSPHIIKKNKIKWAEPLIQVTQTTKWVSDKNLLGDRKAPNDRIVLKGILSNHMARPSTADTETTPKNELRGCTSVTTKNEKYNKNIFYLNKNIARKRAKVPTPRKENQNGKCNNLISKRILLSLVQKLSTQLFQSCHQIICKRLFCVFSLGLWNLLYSNINEISVV